LERKKKKKRETAGAPHAVIKAQRVCSKVGFIRVCRPTGGEGRPAPRWKVHLAALCYRWKRGGEEEAS